MNKKNVITAILIIIYTWLFYRETPGINYLIFCIASISGLILLNKNIVRKTNWIIAAAGSLISALCVTIYGDGLSIFTFILSEILLVTYTVSERSVLIIGWVYPVYSLLGSYIFIITESIKKIQQNTVNKTGASFKILIYTGVAVIVILFFILYRESNPLFYNFTKKINLDFISWSLIGFIITGLLIMYSFFNTRLIKWLHTWESSGSNVLNQSTVTQNKKHIETENRTGIILLLLLNLLLFLVNLLDIIYLWGKSGLPEGMTYSTFVHQGTGTLIASIVIAITIILFLFRSSLNFYEKNKILKYLVFIWIIQNLFMIFSTAFRNHIYISEYVLTYKRIGVYVYLILAGIGLVTTFIKVLKIKSNWYLVRKNSMIFYIILILGCTVSWDKIITNFNLAHSKNIDYKYLISLSDINLPQLLKAKWVETKLPLQRETWENNETRNSYNNKIYYFTEEEFKYNLHKKLYNFLKNESEKNYLSLRYQPSAVFNKIIEFNKEKLIKRLYLNNTDIHYLNPLKILSSVEQLNLANNTIYDIGELNYFPQLEYLDLSYNRIQFTERMPFLPKLKTLKIHNNILKNLHFLNNLPGLETLDISKNNLYNLSGIEKSKNLKALIYQYSSIQNLKALKNLKMLQTLDLSYARNISIESTPDLQSLQDLNLSNFNLTLNCVILGEKLKNFKQLISLNLSGNRINSDYFLFNNNVLFTNNNITEVSILKNLQKLNLSRNDLIKIQALQYYKSLTELDVSFNQIEDISFLKDLKNIRKIYLADNKIAVIEPLKDLQNITDLDISGNKITSLVFIKDLTKLTKLNVSGNSIITVSEISNLVKLKELNLSNNNITDLHGIENLKQIEILNISHNQINNLSPLYNLKQIKELMISGISSIDEKNLKIQLPYTIITIVGRDAHDSVM